MTDSTEPNLSETPKFIGGAPRFKSIKLKSPLAYAGKEYRTICIVRLTAAEVAKFQDELDALLRSDPDATLRFPIFRDETGAGIPDIILNALDDDDKFELDKAAIDFLPRRFRAAPEPVSDQASGGDTAPTSAKLSDGR
jgi:hypothetical protein